MSHKYRHGRPTIGVLAGWQYAWTATPLSYLDPIFRGVGRAAQDLGCNLLLGCGMGPWSDRRESLRAAWPLLSPDVDFVPIGPWNTDGLVVVNPLHSPAQSSYAQDLQATGHPLIFVAAGERGPTIVADNRSGVLEAVQHLVEHGHKRIAFIAGSPDDLQGDTGDRLRAYHDAVEKHGLHADPQLVAWGRHRYDGGYRAMGKILASDISFSAVMTSNDESALGAMQALREDGYRIPQDMAIIGFDDRPESAVQQPPLSSVRIPLRQMGYRAVQSLYDYITGESDAIESVQVGTHLVARDSCGCSERTRVCHILEPRPKPSEPAIDRKQLAHSIAVPILNDAQCLSAVEIETLCQDLVDAFFASLEQGDPRIFQGTLEAVLDQVAASEEETHIWQFALSRLGAAAGGLSSTSLDTARELLDEARRTLSTTVGQQFRRYVVDQRWTLNRLGTLTARLLASLDETEIFSVLAQNLPAMDISTAWLALFDGEDDDDPVARPTLRDLVSVDAPLIPFPTHDFPPEGLWPADQPFSLALFPLTGPRGQLGYTVFGATQLDLYGAITQELATALNSAQLHREATEGRRLAEEANEQKSRSLSMVSHELRSPLNLIVGLSGILLQEGDKPLPARFRKDVERISANARHLSRLIDDVLDLASSDTGQLRLDNEVVDLGEALGLIAETGRQLAHDKGLWWHADLPNSGPWVYGDRTRLRQIVLNLVHNAVKFTTQGQVHLELATGPDSVTVTVRDTGMGIPQEEQALIFDEFHRSERSKAQGYGGLGLGLAICKRLVEMHGGSIGVRSSGEDGAGSVFFVMLPTVQPPATGVQPTAAPARAEESVLVLTNHKGGIQRLREYLNDRGFAVRTAFIDDTSDWLSAVSASPPGAIVVDMSAIQESWEVLRTIKGHPETRELPVLFCSLASDGGAVLHLDYLTKPISVADMTRAMDQQRLVPGAEHDAKKILVVDDEPQTLEMHTRIVQAHSPSHQVLAARNGIEALDILQQERIDLVFLDLLMPELDGFGVLEAMRGNESMRDIPVIVLTGQVLTATEMTRLNQGVATVLSKGVFSLEETLEHVNQALERSRRLSAAAQRLVRQAMAYIHQHYATPISRTELAKHVALSEDYLTACFRKELGVTPIAYLNRYRVNQAKQLLSDPGKSVTEIALEVGFSDGGYFSRIFRREVGVSPETYRQI